MHPLLKKNPGSAPVVTFTKTKTVSQTDLTSSLVPSVAQAGFVRRIFILTNLITQRVNEPTVMSGLRLVTS